MQIISIQSAEWTHAEFQADWADDETTADIAAACADAEYAYLINQAGTVLSGWQYDGLRGAFTGSARADAITLIGELICAAVDYVLEHVDEIRADTQAA
jgi:hypothetical protein